MIPSQTGDPAPSARGLLQAAFREAALALDPSQHPVPSAAIVEAWTILNWVHGQRSWAEAAEEALCALNPSQLHEEEQSAWLFSACKLWVQRASAPVRAAAQALSKALPEGPRTVPACLFYWRITGDVHWLDRAKREGNGLSEATPWVQAKGAWALYAATADERWAEEARAHLRSMAPEALPISLWSTAADALELDSEAFGPAVAAWMDNPPLPEDIVPCAAALSLEPLELRIGWWLEKELFEGPMAEAATFPYPSLRLRFFRLDQRDQVQITPVLGGVVEETVEDVGVITAALDELAAQADLSGLRTPPRRRSPRRGGSW